MKRIIDLDHVNLKYHRQEVLSNVTFKLMSDQHLCLLGPNGAGKTSLLKIIAGLTPISSGSLRISAPSVYLPQHLPSHLSDTVFNICLLGRARSIAWFANPTPTDRQICLDALKLLHLEDFQHHPFNTLSGGQQKLVLIAQCLASQASILLLDEPFSMLDFFNQALVIQVLKQLLNLKLFTLVFSAHNPNHAFELATHTLLIKPQNQIIFGPTSSCITQTNLENLYQMKIDLVNLGANRSPIIIPQINQKLN